MVEQKPKLKFDCEKFRRLWIVGIPAKEIAKEVGVTLATVYWKRFYLNLPKRHTGERPYPLELAKYSEDKRIVTEQKLIKQLEKNKGYIKHQDTEVSDTVVNRMVLQTKIIRIKMDLGRQPGGFKFCTHKSIFHDGYFPYVFLCQNRTALVRLMQNALKRPKDKVTQRLLRIFLKRYLTDAEIFAVYWKLGIRHYCRSQVKSSIQIDGVIKPRRIKVGI